MPWGRWTISNTFKLVGLDGSDDFSSGNADWDFDETGSVVLLNGNAVVDQDFRKVILSTRGQHLFNSNYGSIFRRLIGGKSLTSDITSVIGSEVRRVVDVLKQAQKRLRGLVPLTRDEQLVGVRKVIVAEEEPSNIVIQATIQTVAAVVETEVSGDTR